MEVGAWPWPKGVAGVTALGCSQCCRSTVKSRTCATRVRAEGFRLRVRLLRNTVQTAYSVRVRCLHWRAMSMAAMHKDSCQSLAKMLRRRGRERFCQFLPSGQILAKTFPGRLLTYLRLRLRSGLSSCWLTSISNLQIGVESFRIPCGELAA